MNAREVRELAVRDAKSGLILDAAQKVFAEKGFHETRLEDIGEAAGFSKAALYNYYADKEDIYVSVAIRAHRNIARIVREVIDESMPVLDCVERMISTAFNEASEHFGFALSAGNLEYPGHLKCRMENNEKLGGEYTSVVQSIRDLAASVIERGKKSGEITVKLDSTVLAEFIIDIIQGVFFRWKSEGPKVELGLAAQQVNAFIRQALSGKQIQ